MARFTAIPNPPQADLSGWQYSVLTSLKENVELLTGLRGEKDNASQAVLKSQITIRSIPPQQMQRVSAQGAGVAVSGVSVPTLTDYGALVKDVQTLATDVANLRSVVETLVAQLRG